jgi:hypothetical protein
VGIIGLALAILGMAGFGRRTVARDTGMDNPANPMRREILG